MCFTAFSVSLVTEFGPSSFNLFLVQKFKKHFTGVRRRPEFVFVEVAVRCGLNDFCCFFFYIKTIHHLASQMFQRRRAALLTITRKVFSRGFPHRNRSVMHNFISIKIDFYFHQNIQSSCFFLLIPLQRL